MDSTLVELRDSLANALQTVAAKTEGLYLSLSATFPELVREMRNCLNQSSGLLDRSGCTDPDDQAQDGVCIIDSIQSTYQMVDELSKEFEASYQKDMEIYRIIESSLEEVRALSGHIGQIREDSIAMELISLNAMTVALKAGSTGRAFSYITEELKRLSAKTIELTQTVTTQGEAVLKQFAAFSEKLKTGATMEQDIFGGFQYRIRTSYEGFSKGIEYIVQALDEMRKKTDRAFKPLMRIMEEIQKQDIIRQSIDHVIISLDEIRTIRDDASDEVLLDEYSFLKSLPQLCMNVLTDIRAMVVDSEFVFNQQLDLAQANMDEIEKERATFINEKINDTSAGSMESNFIQSSQVLDRLYVDLDNIFMQKRQTVEGSRDLTKRVRNLDDTFKSFSSLTMRFHTIDIASRIEIAKQLVLKQMAGTVDEMTRLTEQIENDVDVSLKITSNFLDIVQHGFEIYRKHFAGQEHMSKRNSERLRHRHHALLSSKDHLIYSISSFRIFTDVFVNKFKQSRKELANISLLLGEIDAIQLKLQEIANTAEAGFNNVLQRSGRQTWQIHDERLKKVIDRFTIFSHKKLAADLGGFQVEEGVEAGEVTLF